MMIRPLSFTLLGVALVVVQGSRGDSPQARATDAGPNNPPQATLPVGNWNVEFANGVVETCRIGNGGESTVEEPRRGAHGMAVAEAGSVVITFNDDRVERWTSVGKRFVVEHWFPASRLPTVTPVLGIAQRDP
jgi:hypothetical protein